MRIGPGIVVGLLVSTALLACKKSENDPARAGSEAGTAAESPKVDVTMTSAALAKEWVADAAATEKKYAGKVMRLNGDIAEITTFDDGTAYVRLDGVPFKDGKQMDVTCNTKPTRYLKFMQPIANKGDMGGKKPVATIQGTFHKIYPESTHPSMDLEPCELVEPKQ